MGYSTTFVDAVKAGKYKCVSCDSGSVGALLSVIDSKKLNKWIKAKRASIEERDDNGGYFVRGSNGLFLEFEPKL